VSGASEQAVIPGRRPVAEALRAGRPLREILLAERGGGTSRELDRIARAAGRACVPVRRAPRSELDRLARGVVHQGAVAVAPPFPYAGVTALASADVVVVLDGITDPQNVGSVARTAEAAGAGGLVLPRHRAAGIGPAAEKASAGALSWLPVALAPNTARAVQDLADVGFWTVGLSGDAPESIWEAGLLDGKVALVVGAEGAGLSRLASERVDGHVRIPMVGQVGSLNAGVAAAVALYEVMRRRGVHGGGDGPGRSD
jgi:23S rRNA (guanosine2251-2'-O)-methyltransferase